MVIMSSSKKKKRATASFPLGVDEIITTFNIVQTHKTTKTTYHEKL